MRLPLLGRATAMATRIIEVIVDKDDVDKILRVARGPDVVDVWCIPGAEPGQMVVRVLAPMTQCQALIDKFHGILMDNKHRVVLIPTLAVIPEPDEQEQPQSEQTKTAAREELYNTVVEDTKVDSTFVLLIVLSTLVAGIGLVEDNVAVVIGAMVIAPLLGPSLAFAFGVALGDHVLMARALRANAIGLSLAVSVSALAGLALPIDLNSHELLARTAVAYDSVAIALASGAAAVLSLSSGLSSVLVGVMVAVALLPPAAALGLMLGAGEFGHALGAAVLLAVNLVCVNLAAQVVLVSRGVRPRSWWQKKEAHQSLVLNLSLWGVLLLILLGIIYLQGVKPFW
jgi:uncharacterized hydrophobic protein (TIGR00341 family)